MEEMRIYIANLGKYNEGELVGAWFTPPVDFEEVKERIGLNDEYEEYAIHDYELPFAIDEYTPIEEVNRLCEMVEDLPEYIQEELSELQSYFGSIEELCEHEDDIICHSGCDDMADVARYYLEESGQLGELPAHLQNYIDYAAYGRDMELEGNLTSEEQNRGLLDPYVIMENPKDSESLAIDILTFLTGISSRDGEKFPVLRKAIRAVTNSEERGLFKVIEELRAEGTTISTSIADHIESFTDYDFAHLLFSDGDVTQSISLEKQLNIIQVADLVLPDKETSFEEYTTMELLSVAMLIVISTFALDFIHTDRSVFKIVDLDEAWSFLQVAQGKTLSMKLVRAGRAMNAGVYFVTQNTDDLLDEKLKNNLGLKFAFRSTDINEIKKTLAFFGVDSEDENNQKRLRDLENGQCLISDLYGRVGVIQFHPIFEDLFHAFDTRPPVRKEVE